MNILVLISSSMYDGILSDILVDIPHESISIHHFVCLAPYFPWFKHPFMAVDLPHDMGKFLSWQP